MSVQLLSSKVVVVEEELWVCGILVVSTSIVGVVGVTECGFIGEFVFCFLFEEFEVCFGGFTADSDLVLVVMGFFENGGI